MSPSPAPRLGALARVAARALASPLAAVAIGERYWLCSRVGLVESPAPTSSPLWRVATSRAAPLVVADATRDPRFAGDPLVSTLLVRAVAAHPVRGPEGRHAGAVLVLDTAPRAFGADELAALADVAACAEIALLSRSPAADTEGAARPR
jgi:GAF domain-containing protein